MKCNKYEALFTFANDNTLMEHISDCPDCRDEHEKMQKVSQLLKEVKPAFRKKTKIMAKAVACFLFLVLAGSVGVMDRFNQSDLTAEELGFPVDHYGLIMVD